VVGDNLESEVMAEVYAAVERNSAGLVLVDLTNNPLGENVVSANGNGPTAVGSTAAPLEGVGRPHAITSVDYQRKNFKLACAAAGVWLGALDGSCISSVEGAFEIPGRFQHVGSRPTTILDGAKNVQGLTTLINAAGELLGSSVGSEDRPVVVLSLLDHKNVAETLDVLAPNSKRIIFTASSHPRAIPAESLATVAGELQLEDWEVEPNPYAALMRARELAGDDGLVLVTGSLYLVGDLLNRLQEAPLP
jgi:dihydrofolate synthase/folylpolyglutamate synthase